MMATDNVTTAGVDHLWRNNAELLNYARVLPLHDQVKGESHDEDAKKIASKEWQSKRGLRDTCLENKLLICWVDNLLRIREVYKSKSSRTSGSNISTHNNNDTTANSNIGGL